LGRTRRAADPENRMLLSPAPFHLTNVRGKLVITVPWRDAEAIQGYFQRHDVPSVSCWDAAARQARIEVRPGIAAERVRDVLHDWLN
jgi:hypothetical protein